MKHLLLAAAAFALVGSAAPASAHLIDTGTPNGDAVGALVFDSNDYYAGQVSFSGAASIQDIFAHILGGTLGETFTISLDSDTASHLPGATLFSSTATFGADGFNGLTGLSGWNVAAGLYWVAFEIGFGDTLGSSSVTGALLDVGAPNPLSRTAFNPGSGYQLDTPPLSFGLQLDARVASVPEPDTVGLVFGGMAVILGLARRAFRRTNTAP